MYWLERLLAGVLRKPLVINEGAMISPAAYPSIYLYYSNLTLRTVHQSTFELSHHSQWTGRGSYCLVPSILDHIHEARKLNPIIFNVKATTFRDGSANLCHTRDIWSEVVLARGISMVPG
jgi:hypothetical protein